MRIGFTGTRNALELHQQKKVIGVLETLVPLMTYGITGACQGIDAFVAHWLADNSNVDQIIIVPAKRELIDSTLYGLPRAAIVEMRRQPDDNPNGVGSYRRRNEKIIELSDRLVAFWTGRSRSGTKMTMNMAERAGILSPKDVHKI